MLTTDDRAARAALIRVHDVFSNRSSWGRGTYSLRLVDEHGVIHHVRCLMGEVAFQTNSEPCICAGASGMSELAPLYASIRAWFTTELQRGDYTGPESFNDDAGYEQVMCFLAARIAQLDEELCKRHLPPPPPAPPTPPREEFPTQTRGLPVSGLVGTLVGMFARPERRACVTPNLPAKAR